MKYTGAKILIESLKKQNVEYIFGYPGGNVLDIYDELYKQKSIKHILMASEQGATFAGDGYARARGKVGVVLATSGPGATNLVTGIANSFLDSTPLVVITGNVPTSRLGQDSFQEVDIYGVTMPIVKFSYLVKNVNQLEQVVCNAFKIASSGRPGPVLIDIPKDILAAKCEYNGNVEPTVHTKNIEKIIDYTSIANLINESKKPLIYCGGGVVNCDAGEKVLQLAQIIDAPIATTMMGKSAIPYDSQYNVGMTGMHGNVSANQLKEEADLIIALGVRFSDRAESSKAEYERTKIIHVDIDLVELNKKIECDFLVKTDALAFLDNILPLVGERKNQDWWNRICDLQKNDQVYEFGEAFTPSNLIKCLGEYTLPQDIVTTDVGQHQLWAAQNYPFKLPRTFLTSCGLGAMGYAMGASIGGAIATGKRCVMITGDGSFTMNSNELAVAVENKLPVLIIVVNNGVLGMVRQWQTEFYHKRYSGVNIEGRVDFEMLAKSYGVKNAYTVRDLKDFKKIMEKEKNFKLPTLINCIVSAEEKALPLFPIDKNAAPILK